MIRLKTFYFNPYRECTYVLWEAGKQECVLIDAGMYGEREEERLRTFLSSEKLVPIALLITHTHTDHVCGIDFVQQAYGISPIVFPTEGELEAGGMHFQVMRTPGHKEDSVCYYLPSEKWLFTGDTLFQESIGRTDLPGGDMGMLIRSLKKLTTLPDDTVVYPGHGYSTTIGHEKDYNPYL